MAKVAEGIGNNYDEAVKDALNKIGLTNEQVSIELIEEPKKRFFSYYCVSAFFIKYRVIYIFFI